jgi:CheY-like chemotaxis protein
VDEPARAALLDKRAEVGALAARGHHDHRGVGLPGKPRGDLESVDVGQLDVEQDHLGAQPGNDLEGALPVGSLTDDLVTRALEHAAGRVPEASVVVHDQEGHRHLVPIVATEPAGAYTVIHTMALVLVVDDAEKIRAAVRTLLERAGHEVAEAADGRECLRMLYDLKPDLVLLDVSMPDMDGWEALERIRELTWVPILMVTARDAPPERVRGLRGGADDYILKPFEPDELLARIETALRHAAAGGPPPSEPPPRDLIRDDTKLDPW